MKKLTLFDVEKDEWYYQDKIYINPKNSNSLYYELKEFRVSLSNQTSDESMEDNLLPGFSKEETEQILKSLRSHFQKQDSKSILKNRLKPGRTNGFFEDKLHTLREQIEQINRNLQERERMEREFNESIESEIKELNHQLHEISTWSKGDKATIEAIRLELLRQVRALNREKRVNRLNFWKDKVFELRDLRGVLFEYKSIKWMNELAFERLNGVGYGVAK